MRGLSPRTLAITSVPLSLWLVEEIFLFRFATQKSTDGPFDVGVGYSRVEEFNSASLVLKRTCLFSLFSRAENLPKRPERKISVRNHFQPGTGFEPSSVYSGSYFLVRSRTTAERIPFFALANRNSLLFARANLWALIGYQAAPLIQACRPACEDFIRPTGTASRRCNQLFSSAKR